MASAGTSIVLKRREPARTARRISGRLSAAPTRAPGSTSRICPQVSQVLLRRRRVVRVPVYGIQIHRARDPFRVARRDIADFLPGDRVSHQHGRVERKRVQNGYHVFPEAIDLKS